MRTCKNYKLVLVTKLFCGIYPKANGTFLLAFCGGKQGDTSNAIYGSDILYISNSSIPVREEETWTTACGPSIYTLLRECSTGTGSGLTVSAFAFWMVSM